MYFALPRYKLLALLTSTEYLQIYEEEFLRVSTLPYDLIGLINFIYSKQLRFDEVISLLNNPNTKFEGIDGNFNFKNNIIERDLDILRIRNGDAIKIN